MERRKLHFRKISLLIGVGLVMLSLTNLACKHIKNNLSGNENANTALLTDSIRVNQKLKLAKSLLPNHGDSSLKVTKDALSLSKSSGYKKGSALAYSAKGNALMVLGEMDSAEWNYKKALDFSGLSMREKSAIHKNLGSVYQITGEYDSALRYYKLVMNLNPKGDSLLRYLKNSAYYGFADILFSLKRYQESLAYLNNLVAEIKNDPDSWLLANCYNNIATIYEQLGNESLFGQYAQLCVAICDSNHFGDLKLMIYANMSEHYSSRGDSSKAIFYLTQVEKIQKHLISHKGMVYYGTAGIVYFKLGNYKKAIPPLCKALGIAKQHQANETIIAIEQKLAQAYTHVGNYKKANEQYQDYIILKDSLQNLQTRKNVSAYEVKFRTAEKNKKLLQNQIALLHQQSEIKRKNILLIGISFCALVLIVMLISLFRAYRQKQKVQQKDMEIFHQEATIGRLQAFIEGEDKERSRIGRELHDGISSMLTAINMNLGAFRQRHADIYAAKELDNVIKMLQTTGIEIRRTAHDLMPDPIRERSLPYALNDFANSINLIGTFSLELSCSGYFKILPKGAAIIVYRMIQELVHNIIKHAAASHAGIMVHFENNRIKIITEDDGSGFNPQKIKPGIGLSQLSIRVKAMNGFQSIETQVGKGTKISIAFDACAADKLYNHEHKSINN